MQQNVIAAPPQTVLGELTVLPRYLAGFKREREGRGGEGRGVNRKEWRIRAGREGKENGGEERVREGGRERGAENLEQDRRYRL